jgi:hypothetical protein
LEGLRKAMSSIVFNKIKHHLEECKSSLSELALKGRDKEIFDKFIHEVRAIGNNSVDLYTGSLSALEIEQIISSKLREAGLNSIIDYYEWLGIEGYRKIELIDGSHWILRLGLHEKGYIHIHPARSGKYTLRIKGSAWKTALVLVVLHENSGNGALHLEEINHIRKSILSLSPINKFSKASVLIKALRLIKRVEENSLLSFFDNVDEFNRGINSEIMKSEKDSF